MSSGFLRRRSTTALGFIYVRKRSKVDALQVAAGRFSCAAAAATLPPQPPPPAPLGQSVLRGFYNRISVLLQAGVRGVGRRLSQGNCVVPTRLLTFSTLIIYMYPNGHKCMLHNK
jgi:hypothetical protein